MKRPLILFTALAITATRLLADVPADSIWREMLIGYASHNTLLSQKSCAEDLTEAIKGLPEMFGQKGKSPSQIAFIGRQLSNRYFSEVFPSDYARIYLASAKDSITESEARELLDYIAANDSSLKVLLLWTATMNEEQTAIRMGYVRLPAYVKLQRIWRRDDKFDARILTYQRGWAIYHGARHAADDYDLLLCEVLKLHGGDMTNSQNMKPVLTQFGEQLITQTGQEVFPVNNAKEKAKQWADEYCDSLFMKDLVQMFSPLMRENLSKDDLTAARQALNRPQVQLANQHVNEAVQKESFLSGSASLIVGSLGSMLGSTPEDIKAVKCPKPYKKLFDQYMQTNAGKLNELQGSVEAALQEKGIGNNPVARQMMNGMIQYIQKNLPTLMLNAYYGTVTEEDMTALIEVEQEPAVKRLSEASAKTIKPIVANVQELGKKICYIYAGYLMYYKAGEK